MRTAKQRKTDPLYMRKLARVLPMRVLRIEPDDVIVLQTDLHLSKDQVLALRDHATEQFGGYKVAILTHGLKAGVLRRSGKNK